MNRNNVVKIKEGKDQCSYVYQFSHMYDANTGIDWRVITCQRIVTNELKTGFYDTQSWYFESSEAGINEVDQLIDKLIQLKEDMAGKL